MAFTVVYGGSFDPVHSGHRALAEYVSALPEVSGMLLLVTPQNPLKPEATRAPEADRLAMTALALQGIPEAQASDFEASLPQPHFTYATLKALSEKFPEKQFRLLIGSDNWLIFDRWRCSRQIIEEFGVMIYPRPGYPIDACSLPPGVTFLPEAPQTDVSSTEIRDLLSRGEDPNNLMPPGVYNYIKKHHLYGR